MLKVKILQTYEDAYSKKVADKIESSKASGRGLVELLKEEDAVNAVAGVVNEQTNPDYIVQVLRGELPPYRSMQKHSGN